MSALVPPPPAFPPPQLMVPVPYGGGGGTAEGTAARGSYGPVIAMLAVLVVLAAAAVAVGRLCFGRRALAHPGGHQDLEAWVERTCGPCVGAGMLSSAGPAKEEGGGTAAVAVAAEQPPQEAIEPGEAAAAVCRGPEMGL